MQFKTTEGKLSQNWDQILGLSLFRIPQYYENMRLSILKKKKNFQIYLIITNCIYKETRQAGRPWISCSLLSQALPTPRPQEGPLPSHPVVEVGIGRYGDDVCVYECAYVCVCVAVWGAV